MLATGDGTPGLKFGSTNAYTEDASGKPVYDWTITDRIIDTYLQAGRETLCRDRIHAAGSLLAPGALHSGVETGRHRRRVRIGWSYPPKDYAKWGELVNQWVKHAVASMGALRWRAGIGKYGMSPISVIGTARRKSTTSCTTMRRTGEARASHGENRRTCFDRAERRSRRRFSCVSFWSTARRARMPLPAGGRAA